MCVCVCEATRHLHTHRTAPPDLHPNPLDVRAVRRPTAAPRSHRLPPRTPRSTLVLPRPPSWREGVRAPAHPPTPWARNPFSSAPTCCLRASHHGWMRGGHGAGHAPVHSLTRPSPPPPPPPHRTAPRRPCCCCCCSSSPGRLRRHGARRHGAPLIGPGSGSGSATLRAAASSTLGAARATRHLGAARFIHATEPKEAELSKASSIDGLLSVR